MLLALISDIHGNLISLDAVLQDIRLEGVEHIIFLGDAATLGPQPREVLARLQELNCPCVMGNHDAFLLNPALLGEYDAQPWVHEAVAWCQTQLTAADLEYLSTFQMMLEVTLDPDQPLASKMLCFHGSPRSYLDIIIATTPQKKLKKMLKGHKAAVLVGGHSHVQMLRQYRGSMLINAGSVGMPFRKTPFKGTPRILPWAEYAIVSWRSGVLSATLRRVPVSLEAIHAVARASDMPDRNEWVNNWQLPHQLW